MFLVIVMAILLIGCTSNDPAKANTNSDEIGIVLDGIDVPDLVLEAAKGSVQKTFDIFAEDYPDYKYANWRIISLSYNYTYEELEGMKLVLYQLNYEFLSESPDSVVLAGGMYMTEDDWVMPTYPNSTYLIFQEDDNTLTFLESIMINDASPGSQLFTEDISSILQ